MKKLGNNRIKIQIKIGWIKSFKFFNPLSKHIIKFEKYLSFKCLDIGLYRNLLDFFFNQILDFSTLYRAYPYWIMNKCV